MRLRDQQVQEEVVVLHRSRMEAVLEFVRRFEFRADLVYSAKAFVWFSGVFFWVKTWNGSWKAYGHGQGGGKHLLGSFCFCSARDFLSLLSRLVLFFSFFLLAVLLIPSILPIGKPNDRYGWTLREASLLFIQFHWDTPLQFLN